MLRSKFHERKYAKKKDKLKQMAELTARAEVLNREEEGFIEADEGELTHTIRQTDIANAVDLASASKHFDLNLQQFGPYKLAYTNNGRHLLLGGKKGHIASLDWQTKKLHCEINVMENIRDVCWLHTENLYAVAQKHYTYVYDNTGTELHCVKTLPEVNSLEFLPRHFLLVAGSKNSYLNYLDVSIGQNVASFCTKSGSLDVMCSNPANAIIYTGHGNGTVSLWSPNDKEPLVKLLCHPSSVQGLAINDTGTFMYTTGLDRRLRVWDVRMYRQLHAYSLPFGLSHVTVSQRNVVACAIGNTVQVFNDTHLGTTKEPYLVHRAPGPVSDIEFVPYEDVLGIGHSNGFTSMIVPGCGEANVDTLRANPYETKSQRKEREVKQLLDKLQPDLICLDPNDINRVNETLLEEVMEERKKLLYVRPVDIKYTPKHKMKGRSQGKRLEHRKNTVKGEIRLERSKNLEMVEKEFNVRGGAEKSEPPKKKSVLDRFAKK
ncbi:unnamed protein product [Auanema sp. JU1783]|nr:unnamed protein product [Auanema sp. JU1783]